MSQASSKKISKRLFFCVILIAASLFNQSPEGCAKNYQEPEKRLSDLTITQATTPLRRIQTISPDRATTGREFVLALEEFDRIGPNHFANKAFDSVPAKQIETCQTFTNSVFRFRSHPCKRSQWQRLANTSAQISDFDPKITSDPLLLFCQCYVDVKLLQEDGWHTRMKRCLKQFEASDYPARTAILAYQLNLTHPFGATAERDLPSRACQFANAVLSWLNKDLRAEGRQHRMVYLRVRQMHDRVRKLDPKCAIEFNEAVARNIKLPTWLRLMLRGDAALFDAYRALAFNGRSWVVVDRAKHEKLVKRGYGFFEKAYQSHPFHPESACGAMKMAIIDSDPEKIKLWFERAIAAQKDYLLAYQERLGISLPISKGSIEQLKAFAELCVANHSPDNLVGTVFLDCIKIAAKNFPDDAEGKAEFLGDPKIQQAREQIIFDLATSKTELAETDRFASPTFFQTQAAVLALGKKELALADRIIRKLGKEIDPVAMQTLGLQSTSFEVFRGRAYAQLGEYSGDAKELEKLMARDLETRLRNVDEIKKFTDQILSDIGSSPSSTYFRQANLQAILESKFDRGYRIQLPLEKDFLLWSSPNIYRWSIDGGGNVTASATNEKGSLGLDSIVKSPGPKTITWKVTAEIASRNDNEEQRELIGLQVASLNSESSQQGFAIGFCQPRFSPETKRLRGRIQFGKLGAETSKRFFDVPWNEGCNVFQIKVWENYLECYLNDRFVFRTSPEKWGKTCDQIKLRNWGSSLQNNSFSIQSIELQKLVAEHPSPQDFDALVKFYEQQMEDDAKDKWNYFWKAHALHALRQDPTGAIHAYQQAVTKGVPEADVGFWIGEILEGQTQFNEAAQWYRKAASVKGDQIILMHQTNKLGYRYSTPHQWASARLRWLKLNGQWVEKGEANEPANLVTSAFPSHLAWLTPALLAQEAANEGDFWAAKKELRKTLSFASVDTQKRLLQVLEAYEKEEVYRNQSGAPSLYQLPKPTICFFEEYENSLPPRSFYDY